MFRSKKYKTESKKILCPKIFGSKNVCGKQKFGPKNLGQKFKSKTIFGSNDFKNNESLVWVQKTLGPKK